jgi:hypothetical protein
MMADEVKHAPYVFAFRDMHNVAGSNNQSYILNLKATENSRYAVVHIATPLRDPDDNSLLGYEAIYTATALVQHPGDPAKALLIDPARETLRGDRLLSAENTETPVTFTPRAPSVQVKGRIIDVVGGTDLIGQYAVIVINRGKSQGIEPGSVLAIDQAGDIVPDLYRGGRNIGSSIDTTFAPKVKLPDERNGTLLVFKVFDRLSTRSSSAPLTRSGRHRAQPVALPSTAPKTAAAPGCRGGVFPGCGVWAARGGARCGAAAAAAPHGARILHHNSHLRGCLGHPRVRLTSPGNTVRCPRL